MLLAVPQTSKQKDQAALRQFLREVLGCWYVRHTVNIEARRIWVWATSTSAIILTEMVQALGTKQIDVSPYWNGKRMLVCIFAFNVNFNTLPQRRAS